MESSWESDDSVTFIENEEEEEEVIVKKEADDVLDNFHNAICDSKTVVSKPYDIKTEQIDNADTHKKISYASRAILKDVHVKSDIRKLPLLFKGKYFKLLQTDLEAGPNKKSKGMLAECNFCESGKLLRGTMNITSNFLQHLKKRHPVQYERYIQERQYLGKGQGRVASASKEIKATTSTATSSGSEPMDIECRFDEKVLSFIVENGLPLSIVQTSSFINLFEETSLVVQPLKFYTNILDLRYSKAVQKVRETLSTVSYLCTSLNVWLFKGKFIFGYTCHWINDAYCRKSVVLGFRSFGVEKAYQEIPDYLQATNHKLGVPEDRIVCAVTNSDDEVVQGFKEFDLNDYYEIGSDQEEEEEQAQSLPDLSRFDHRFPAYDECVIQNLFSLVTTDFIELLKLNERLFQLHRAAFRRCSEIWKKCTSPAKCDMIRSFVLFPLKFPTSTDWTTLYESIRSMLNCKDKLGNLCIFLETLPFKPTEIEYLEEYCQLMEPFASALKFLQTESQMLFGYFLPTLVTIKVKLHKLDCASFKNMAFVAEQMGNKLFERFQNFFEMRPECVDAVIAAVSCPVIKFKFVKALNQIVPKVTEEIVETYFINYAREFQGIFMENNGSRGTRSTKTITVDESFFDFEQNTKPVKEENDPLVRIKREIIRYLADEDCSLNSLDRYPVVKKLFFKYNTPLPSYASVRRLFAYSGLTSCRRNLRMSGRHFERLVFMEAVNDSL